MQCVPFFAINDTYLTLFCWLINDIHTLISLTAVNRCLWEPLKVHHDEEWRSE